MACIVMARPSGRKQAERVLLEQGKVEEAKDHRHNWGLVAGN